MSRCFPFPPPGYERKHIPEDLVVLKVAKHKEKKQKKEKKDREKRKDRDKKEKDGSGEKHGDKKDRKEKNKEKKEKHRDKTKDENLGKDEEKSSILESTVDGKLETKSGEKLHPGGRGSNERSPVDEGECSTLSRSQNGAKPFDKILASQATTEAKFVQELGRRIREDEKISGNQFPESVSRVEERDQKPTERMAIGNHSVVLVGEKGDSRHKGVDFGKDVSLRNELELTRKPIAQNLARAAEIKVEGIPQPVEEQNAWRLDRKEKSNGIGDDRGGEEPEDKDKKIHRKDKDKKNDMTKEEKSKKKTQKTEHEKSKKLRRNDDVGATNNENRNLFLNVETATPNEANIKKRKDRDANGFLHENEIRPNKIQWHTLHQATENGRKLEAAQISSKSSSDTHAFPNNFQLDHRDRLTNGIVEAQKATPSKPNHSIAPIASDQIGSAPKSHRRDSSNANKELTVPKMEDLLAEASMRPPHPDSKYLGQVLKVPNVGKWPEYDDQEWLFSKKDPPEKKPISGLASVAGELPVWSKAVHIESADVCAMPYVIPY